MLQSFGLDRPLHEQYVIYLINLLKGQLGDSFLQGRPVAVDYVFNIRLVAPRRLIRRSPGSPERTQTGPRSEDPEGSTSASRTTT